MTHCVFNFVGCIQVMDQWCNDPEWQFGWELSSDGKFILNEAFGKNARRQPVFYQLYDIKNCTKTLLIDVYNYADLRQTREICPFNIYGKIVYKAKKGSAFYYSLLSFKNYKTLLWEKSQISLES